MRKTGYSILVTRYTKSRIKRAGFTLIELLVVIAIITALLAILIPGLGKARGMAKRMRCAANLRQIDIAMRLYLGENKDTYPCAQDPVINPNIWLWMGRGWRGFIAPYFGEKIDVNNPSVLLCPADNTEPNKYEATSYSYSMAFYHSPEQINDMNSKEDTYKNTPKPSVQQESDRVANPAKKIIVGEWNSHHRRIEGKDPGWWGWAGSRNFLFADGHALFLEAEKIRPANDGNPNPNLTKNGIEGMDWPR